MYKIAHIVTSLTPQEKNNCVTRHVITCNFDKLEKFIAMAERENRVIYRIIATNAACDNN